MSVSPRSYSSSWYHEVNKEEVSRKPKIIFKKRYRQKGLFFLYGWVRGALIAAKWLIVYISQYRP